MTGDRLPSGADSDGGAPRILGDRYRLISRVGQGGMAVVWEAYDSVLARTVAVKVLSAHYADDHRSRDLIRREAQAAGALSHPNIAQVYDYGEAEIDGELIPYVVLELIRGDTLDQRLRAGPVPPRFAMRVCAEVAAALAAAHAEGLAHRDIKPANVMLASTGAKVVDFGIAAAIRPTGSGAADFEVLGTPAYLAPERLLHDAVEPASDVYALGVLLYRLLAGHSPWTSETTTQMLTAHVYLEPEPLQPTSSVPDHVTALCNRCLAKDPTERPSAREAAALLARGAGLQVITDEPAGRSQPALDPEPSVLIRAAPVAPAAPAPAGRRKRAVYALIAALVLAGCATTWWLWPAAGHPAPVAAPVLPSATSAATPERTVVNPPAPRSATTTGAVTPGGAVVIVTSAVLPPPGTAAPQNPAAPVPGAPGPGPTSPPAEPEPADTTTAPVPADEPVERTLSSTAGSVRATCPAPATAQILSWTATKPYKVAQGDTEAGASPAVVFTHGKTQVTMTVTCSGGEPSATTG